MEMQSHGTIDVNGFKLRFTEGGQWLVSIRGTFIGYADTLSEAEDLTKAHKANVKERLEKVEAQARAKVSVTTCDICCADFTENLTEGSVSDGDSCPSCNTGTLVTH
ncbi:MAG: hypothetical protein ACW99U_20165 [Candidatus Thorarchaeota archaeon]